MASFVAPPSLVAASATPRVVLVAGSERELVRKVKAEAEHVGIEVDVQGASMANDAELLRQHDAVGVVYLLSPDRVRIYVAASGEHAAYETAVERALADGDSFAVRVVEQVRGRLVELRLLPLESAPEAAPPETSQSSSTQRSRERASSMPDASGPVLGIAVGASGVAALGGVGPTPGVALGLRVEPNPRWAVAAHFLVPLVENEISAAEGEADVRVHLFFAELGYRLALRGALFQPELGAGAGLVVLPLSAEARAPLQGHDDRLLSGIFFLQGGLAWAPSPWFRLRGTLRAGVSAPRPVLRFDSREVATWGRAFLASTLEAELVLPLAGTEGAP